jgi:segregation and condensation protein B
MADEERAEDNAEVLDCDYDDQETAPEENENELDMQAEAVLEGLLFITGDEGLTLEQAAEALGIEQERCEHLLDDMMQKYLKPEHGIELARYGNIYKFVSKAVVHDYASRLFSLNKTSKLSQAALETLAIVAYKQPVTRVEIEEIRGVGADVMLRKLEARGLIREAGRSDAPGRPILYEVTDTFMDAFELVSLDELPDLPDFKRDEEGSDLFGGGEPEEKAEEEDA